MNITNIIPVDFNNCDEDGAVRLNTRGTITYLKENQIEHNENDEIIMLDGELRAEGIIEMRDEIWVAKVIKWF